MNKTRFTFIRNRNNVPIGCIAYQINKDEGELKYELSVHNPADPFDRRLARTIAEGRLNKHPRIFAFEPGAETTPPQLLRQLTQQLIDSYQPDGWKMTPGGLPKRVFVALSEHLAMIDQHLAIEETGTTKVLG